MKCRSAGQRPSVELRARPHRQRRTWNLLANADPAFHQCALASSFASQSLTRTARVAWWSAHCANKIINRLREKPFTNKELSTLTDGRLTSVRPVDVSTASPTFGGKLAKMHGGKLAKMHGGKLAKIGRNDPCPCGSGEKYKGCCGRQGKLDEALKSYRGSLFRS
jgi:hypothetical protein